MSSGKHIRRLAGETAVYGISGVAAQLVNVLLLPLYTRMLTVSEVGLMTVLTSFSSLVSTFVVLGLDSASARFYYDSDDSSHRRQVMGSWFWCQFTFGFAVAMGLVLASRPLSQIMLESARWAPLVILVSATVIARTVIKVLGNWLRYQRRAWTMIGFSVATSLLLVSLTVVFLVPMRMGLLGLYWAQFIAGLATAVIAVFLMKNWIAPRLVSPGLLKAMLMYGLPLIPAALASYVTAGADRFFLLYFRDPAEIGLYGTAVTIASAVTLGTGAFQMAWGPFAFSILHHADAGQVYGRTFTLFGFWGCWFATGLSLFAPIILKWFTTPPFYSASSCIPYLAFGYLAVGATYIAALGSTIVKKSLPVAISIFIGAGINTVLNFILIPRFGKDGAAISTLAAYTAASVYLFFRSQKLYPIPYRFWQVGQCLALSGVVVLIDRFFISSWHAGAFGIRTGLCLLFLPLSFYLKIVTVQKLKEAFHRLRKRLTTGL